MHPDLAQLARMICATNWFEVIKTAASVAVAIVAFLALQNWKRQDRAKRQAEFLDALIEAVHAYISEMSGPVTLLQFGQIGMNSHIPVGASGDEDDKKLKGAIAYIEKRGEDEGKRVIEALNNMQPSVIKLRSLAAKGQVFHFQDYAGCRHAIELLAWQFDRIEAFAIITKSSTLNWQNPDVLQRLKDILAMDPDEMRQTIRESNIVILKFVSDTYKRMYG